MTTFTDPYSTFNWQDGMEVNVDVLNNGQRFVRAQLYDQILQSRAAALSLVGFNGTVPDLGARGGADMESRFAWAISPGWAFLRQGSANNKIQIAPGTLLQKIANSDGNDATLVPFTFAGTEEFTLADGDATNPRVDLLQMKLEYVTDTTLVLDLQDAVTRALTTPTFSNTRRRVRCTLTVKAGTPAASPVIPDPDAGFVPIGTAVVGHGWTSAGNAPEFGLDLAESGNVVVHDQRMPIGVAVYRTDPVLFKLETAWALASTNQVITSSNATNRAFAPCQFSGGRLIACDIRSISAAIVANAITLGFLGNGGAGAAPSTTYIKSNSFPTSPVAGIRALLSVIDGAHNPASGPVIQPSPVNAIGVPLWTSGYRTWQVASGPTNGTTGGLSLSIQNQTNGTSIGEVAFYVAAGL